MAVGPDLSFNGDKDGFVAKVNAEGTGLVYCGYIGGLKEDYIHDLAVDSYGSVRESAGGVAQHRVPQATGAVGNLDALNEAAAASGYFNVFPDPNDGLYRRMPTVIRFNGEYALPLSLAMVRAHLGDPTASLQFQSFGAEKVRLGKQ